VNILSVTEFMTSSIGALQALIWEKCKRIWWNAY